jgi:hypothetical protein
MCSSDARQRGLPAALANPFFRRLWLGQAISHAGDGLATLATLLVVNRLSGSTPDLAGVAIATALPQLLFGFIAGVFVDRWDHRRVLIASDVVRALLVLGLILIRDRSHLWAVYVLSFAQASVGTLFIPAMGAFTRWARSSRPSSVPRSCWRPTPCRMRRGSPPPSQAPRWRASWLASPRAARLPSRWTAPPSSSPRS